MRHRSLNAGLRPGRFSISLAGLLIAMTVLTGCVTTADPDAVIRLESRDWGIAATDAYRESKFHAPTPLAAPGARSISTAELSALLAGPPGDRPIVIDVLGAEKDTRIRTLPEALWLPGGGLGSAFPRLETKLEALTDGDKSASVVFLCLGPECWLSYNASLRAVHVGYSNVWWYRGGHDAWKLAGYPLVEASPAW